MSAYTEVNISEIISALFRGPGALAQYFRIPFLPLHTSYFFRSFDLISYFLLHGRAKGLNYRVQSTCCGEAGPIYTFLKKIQTFFGTLSALWAFCPPFLNSPSHAPYPHVFSRTSTFFYTSFFRVSFS